jgi:hypothetical protein
MNTLIFFFQMQILSWMFVAPVLGCFIPFDGLLAGIVSGFGLAAFLYGKCREKFQVVSKQILLKGNSPTSALLCAVRQVFGNSFRSLLLEGVNENVEACSSSVCNLALGRLAET